MCLCVTYFCKFIRLLGIPVAVLKAGNIFRANSTALVLKICEQKKYIHDTSTNALECEMLVTYSFPGSAVRFYEVWIESITLGQAA